MKTVVPCLIRVGLVLLCAGVPMAASAVRELAYALELDGSNQYARLASNHAPLANVETMTAEIWFKTSAAINQSPISQYRRGGRDSGWYLGLLSDGQTVQLRWQARQSQITHDFLLPSRYDDGQWHHLAFAAGVEQVEVFYDGQSLGTRPSEGRLVPPATVFAMGAIYVESFSERRWFFDGQLAEVRFWRGARSAARIAADWNRRLFGDEPGLLGYWPLNDGTGTTAADASPSGYPATVYGDAPWVRTDLSLSSFTIADSVTGNREVIHVATAAVVRFPAPPGYDRYRVTEDDTPPTGGWVSTNDPPATIAFTLPAEPGPVTLYAWFTNSTETVPLYHETATIEYATEAMITTLGDGGGTVPRAPDALDDVYDLGTALTLTADANPDHHFLFWRGDLPPGAYPTNNPLSFTVDQDRALTAVFAADAAPVRIWTGAGANTLADTAANWLHGIAPQSGESVFFGFSPTNGAINCTWNLDITVADWTQTEDFDGVISFETVYSEAGSFSNLTITGDCRLEGGRWTHTANTGNDDAINRLAATVAGSFTLGPTAMIDLMGRGYAAFRGPGAGVSGTRIGRGGSHGGMGAHSGGLLPTACYGDPVTPMTLGSGGNQRGGGALDLTVNGTAVIHGHIDAEGMHRGTDQDVSPGSAGGSIRLRAASIDGSGRLTARGSIGHYAGAGGRIALTADSSADIGVGLRRSAAAGERSWSSRSTAGTIYLKTTAYERLIVDAQALIAQAGLATELPPGYETYPVHPAVGGPMENAALILTNRAQVRLTRSLRMGDFAWIEATSGIDLNSYSLYLKADEPAGVFPDDYGNGTILYNEGFIVWGNLMPNFVLETTHGPNGTISRDPDQPDNLYPVGAIVTNTAHPDPGHHFIWWTGELPVGADRTANPLVLEMDRRYAVRALFASDDPAMRTWTGEGADTLASSPENWYPTNAPATGNHILFNGISDKACLWDLAIEPASWTQTADYVSFWSAAEGYRGWIDFAIRYPGFGGFTNLTISGDVDLQAGTWSHPFNDIGHIETDRLRITVEGNFTLGSLAEINMNRRAGSGGYTVESRGFANSSGPSPGSGGARENVLYSASHGGRGGYRSDSAPQPCTGSFAAPRRQGSGGYRGRGGGALRLNVGGLATIDGLIDAGTESDNRHSGGAGGSIWLTAGTLAGAGQLRVHGGGGYLGGGGGRIAVILSASDDFADVTMTAWGGRNRGGEAGTVYRWGVPGPGRLIINNNGYAGDSLVNFTELYADPETDFPDTVVEIVNGGRAGVVGAMPRIYNLVMDPSATLYLQGHDLIIRSPYPREGFTGNVIGDGGMLIWTLPGTLILLH